MGAGAAGTVAAVVTFRYRSYIARSIRTGHYTHTIIIAAGRGQLWTDDDGAAGSITHWSGCQWRGPSYSGSLPRG